MLAGFYLKSVLKWNLFFQKYSLCEAQLEFVWKISLQEMTWVLTSSIKKWSYAAWPGEPIHHSGIFLIKTWFVVQVEKKASPYLSVCKTELVIFPLNPAPPPELPIFVNSITILAATQAQNPPVIFASFSPSAAPQPPVCSQLCLPILALVCPLLCSHCCCPSSGAYSLLPGLQQ